LAFGTAAALVTGVGLAAGSLPVERRNMHAKLVGAIGIAVAALVLAGPAEAQWRGSSSAGAYESGYRDGARAGDDDARDGRGYEYQRHRDYRAGDRGYDRTYGGRDDYARQYRAGVAAGYRDGYYSRGGRRSAPVYRSPVPGWGDPRYDQPGYRRPGNGGGVSDDIGYANGFEEGYKRGLDDGRDGDRYDPRRHGRYRDADQGYRREYGSKGVYESSYRRGFERGYAQGYQDTQRRGGRRW
jgi:hypothetical protein